MSIQTTPITVVLANRPRLFRELLQHALNTEPSQFRVVEAADAMPSPALLRDADWLIIDDESATEAAQLAEIYPTLGILALEGRGSRARVLAPAKQANEDLFSDAPTLAQIFKLLSHELALPKEKTAS